MNKFKIFNSLTMSFFLTIKNVLFYVEKYKINNFVTSTENISPNKTLLKLKPSFSINMHTMIYQ